MFRCNHRHQGAHYLSLLKLHLLKQSVKIHRCVVNLVVWLHMLSGPCWCVSAALFRNQTASEQCGTHTSKQYLVGRDGSVGIATRYRQDGPGIESRLGETFRFRPDRAWGPPSLLYDG
jgi:hypothetical protein